MGLFPTDANDGDEVTNTHGTIFKYHAGDDRWYIVSSTIDHNDLPGLNDGDVYEHISAAQLADLHAIVVAGDLDHNDTANIDADDIKHITAAQLGALHSQPVHNSLSGLNDGTSYEHITQTQKDAILNSKKVIIYLTLIPRTEQLINGSRIDLIAQGTDYAGANFLAHADMVDDTKEILFIWVYRALVTDGAFAMHRFRAAIRTNNTEVHSWNLDNATAFNMAVTANRVNTLTYTFAVADYDAGDHLFSLLRLNDAAGDMYIEGCYCIFYLK